LINRLKRFAGRLFRPLLLAIVAIQSLVTGCDEGANWKGVTTNRNENRDGATIRDASAKGSANEPKL
jgi:hypothetical protein